MTKAQKIIVLIWCVGTAAFGILASVGMSLTQVYDDGSFSIDRLWVPLIGWITATFISLALGWAFGAKRSHRVRILPVIVWCGITAICGAIVLTDDPFPFRRFGHSSAKTDIICMSVIWITATLISAALIWAFPRSGTKVVSGTSDSVIN